MGCVSDSPADRLVGYVQSCRRDSQDQDQNQPQDRDPEQLQDKEQQEESPDVLRGPNEKIHQIKLATLNIANLMSSKKYKIKHLEAMLRDEDIKILGLQETWLNDEILEAETHIDGYVNYRQDRGGVRKGGGTSTYISNSLTVTKHESYTNTICDCVYVEIEELNFGVINLYRPPSSDANSFDDILKQIKDWVDQSSREIILVGDLNFPDQSRWTEADKEGIRESIQGRP